MYLSQVGLYMFKDKLRELHIKKGYHNRNQQINFLYLEVQLPNGKVLMSFKVMLIYSLMLFVNDSQIMWIGVPRSMFSYINDIHIIIIIFAILVYVY